MAKWQASWRGAMSATYHKATEHSYWSVRRPSRGLDWSMQPSPFKIYEEYPLIPLDLDNPTHKFIYYLGGIDAKKSYPGVEYYLRTIPSAGALYPTEIYLQIREVEGFEDGIYHFDVAHGGVRLLHPLAKDEGVEVYFGDKRQIKGFLILYSTIYYRSSWKYKNRAYRYCLLDAGHALGALEISAFLYDHAYHIHYDFDIAALNERFGFGQRESFVSSGIVGVPTSTQAVRLDMQLPFVDGSKTFEPNPMIEEVIEATRALRHCHPNFRYPKMPFVKERLDEVVVQRRSIRDFQGYPIQKAQLEFVLDFMRQPIPSDCDEEVKIWYVINNVKDVPQGLYKDGQLIKAGDFRAKAGYLCLEQALGSQSAVTFFLTGSGQNYRPMMQKAGHIGHRCYIASEYQKIGCSGIGAFYDQEVQEFLGTEDMVLYALAIGV